MINKKVRNDIILIAAILIIAAITAIAYFLLTITEGEIVAVYVDGNLYGEFPLYKDTSVEISSKNGTNILVISDGKAKISEASCPDLRCAHHHAISKSNEQIICLPNKVVISIE